MFDREHETRSAWGTGSCLAREKHYFASFSGLCANRRRQPRSLCSDACVRELRQGVTATQATSATPIYTRPSRAYSLGRAFPHELGLGCNGSSHQIQERHGTCRDCNRRLAIVCIAIVILLLLLSRRRSGPLTRLGLQLFDGCFEPRK